MWVRSSEDASSWQVSTLGADFGVPTRKPTLKAVVAQQCKRRAPGLCGPSGVAASLDLLFFVLGWGSGHVPIPGVL